MNIYRSSIMLTKLNVTYFLCSEITHQTTYAHPCLVGGCYLVSPYVPTLVPPYLLEEIPHWLIVYSKGQLKYLIKTFMVQHHRSILKVIQPIIQQVIKQNYCRFRFQCSIILYRQQHYTL